jgi:hypothetical protein
MDVNISLQLTFLVSLLLNHGSILLGGIVCHFSKSGKEMKLVFTWTGEDSFFVEIGCLAGLPN